MTEKEVDVVVIGAGLSGINCACLLKKNKLKVAVLEARDRVGGRTWTLRHPKHGSIDLGAGYVGPGQNRMYRLAKQLGLQVFSVDESKKTVLNLNGNWSTYIGQLPSLSNPLAYLDMNNLMRTINNMARQVPLGAPWKAKKAKEWDLMTVQEFFDKTCWTRETRNMGRILVNAVYAVEPCEMSLLFFLRYIHAGQSVERMSMITNGAQEKKIAGGSQQVSEKLYELIKSSVYLSSPVKCVLQRSGHVEVHTTKDQVFKCRYVVSSVPLPLLTKIEFSPPLPPHKMQLVQKVPMGAVIKTFSYYDKAFWRELEFNGIAVSDSGPSGYCIEDVKEDGSHPGIMAFILANKTRELTCLSEEERKQKILQHLAEMFKCDKFLKPIGYVEKNWMEEEYSGGCYTAVMGPGVMTQYGREIRKPFDRVYFAGTETAREWAGYMEGAVESGERAAREVLCALGKIQESEIWQEEPESLEYPSKPINQDWIEEHMPSVPTCLLGLIIPLFVGIAAVVFGCVL